MRIPRNHSNAGGSAVIIFITLLAIMMILVTANSRALVQLHRNIKLLEQRQIQRLDGSQTNAVIAVEPPAKSGAP
ncbi:MAG: hypothetical protein ABSE16_08530 [Verrucomicrobiota bacterium]|jgi:hypothetical protein